MFRRIVMATDFAESAEHAWRVAMELARAHQAELTLVHVYTPLPVYPEVAVPQVAQIYEEQRRWVEEALAQRVAAATAQGVKAKPTLVTGAPVDGIADAAAAERADLVVIGTHGRQGLERLVVGSVAERVVRTAPCPVLVVKGVTAQADAARQARSAA